MSQLNIKELYSTINSKNIKRMEIYDDILQKCHSKIKYNSNLERTYCFFQIPEFIIGIPIYNINELRIYIMNSLKKDGFEYLYVEPNWLFISWFNKSTTSLVNKNVEIKNIKNIKNLREKNVKYKSVDSVQNSLQNTGVYDQSVLLGFSEKLK